MLAIASDATQPAVFTGSRDRFESVLAWLEGEQAGALSHGELEERLQVDARELFRQLMQDHLDLRAQSEPRIADVRDAQWVPRPTAETGHRRGLATVFGGVEVRRIAYRRRGEANLHPADAVLNLPAEKHSHGLRCLAAIESSRGSFDAAVEGHRAQHRATPREAAGRRPSRPRRGRLRHLLRPPTTPSRGGGRSAGVVL